MKNLPISSLPCDPSLVPEITERVESELRRRTLKRKCEQSLIEFVREFWPIVEPAKPLVEGLVLNVLCDHLEAVSRGDIQKILINVPPGSMKSLLSSVFFPAWEWTTRPHLRYVMFSYSSGLTERDNRKFASIITSPKYQGFWGDKVQVVKCGETLVTNTATGSKLATSVGGVGTGERGDRVILDDPHNVKSGESEAIRTSTVEWFAHAMSNRLNDMAKSAIIVVMQRVHELDVSGFILEKVLPYEWLMIPAEFEESRRCQTSIWQDWREEEGELFWPERFPREVLDEIMLTQGSIQYAGQYQQRPMMKGGGILKYEYWQDWDEAAATYNGSKPGTFPKFDYVLASTDTAFTEKQENDPSALVVLGVWTDRNRRKRVMLCYAWSKHLELSKRRLQRGADEDIEAFKVRQKASWGLVEWIADSCITYKVDKLLVESKASGISLSQEIRKLYSREEWSVQLINPGSQDKVSRAYQVQPMFEAGMIYAPVPVDGREAYGWVEALKSELAVFPKGKHDDRVDCITQGLSFLRSTGMLHMDTEVEYDTEQSMMHRGKPLAPIYPA
jgi:predicted phage terminase large subunit-like protein